MTNWEKEQQNFKWNGISAFDIPTDIFSKIKDYAKASKQDINLATHTLAGHIKEEYNLLNQEISEDVIYWLEDRLLKDLIIQAL